MKAPRAAVAIVIASHFLLLALILFARPVFSFVTNAGAGCFPWSPSDVEYYPGMTLCPGQTAHGVIVIELPRRSRDDGGI